MIALSPNDQDDAIELESKPAVLLRNSNGIIVLGSIGKWKLSREALVFGTVLILSAASAAFVAILSRTQPMGMDFAPIWAAVADPRIAYDARAVSDALGFSSLRPFAYPPTTIALFWPFGMLPFSSAYGLFAFAGLSLLAGAAMKAGAPWWTALFPPVALALQVGQASLLVGGLVLSGLMVKDYRRGLLFGLAVSIKPQLCLFLPLALDGRGLVAAAAVPLTLAMLITSALGVEVWSAWLGAAEVLTKTVESRPELTRNLLQTSPFFLAVAVPILWLTRKADVRIRFGALVGCAVIVSPYAMNYELALLAPAVAGRLFLSLFLGLGFLAGSPVLLIVLLGLALAADDLARRERDSGPERGHAR